MAINTVTGKCNARDLGFTLIHEHLTAGFPGWELDNRGFNRKAEVGKAVDRMQGISGPWGLELRRSMSDGTRSRPGIRGGSRREIR